MKTRTMGRLILTLGCAGLAAGVAAMVQGPTIAGMVPPLRVHLLLALLSTLILTLALSWLALFAFGSWRALLANSRSADQRDRSLGEGKRALYRILLAALSAVVLGAVSFVLGFDVYAGEMGTASHVVLTAVSLFVQALALLAAARGLRTLEDLADDIEDAEAN